VTLSAVPKAAYDPKSCFKGGLEYTLEKFTNEREGKPEKNFMRLAKLYLEIV
jgi:hypothetical protein